MTVPPGGPYGQDPYGTNPYGQGPYWGGQPQGGPPPQYPQGPPPQYPQGGPYSYPPGGYPQDPAAGGGYQQPYPPTDYAKPGQQVPPGWAPGPYPPGPPPSGGSSSKLPWLILAGVAVLGVIALVIILVVSLGGSDKPATTSPGGTSVAPPTQSAPTSEPNNTQQTATDCTPNVSGGEKPVGGSPISAGQLSFPTNVAPGWMPISDDQTPNLIGAVGVAKEVPGANQWVMQAEVAVTNFVSSMDVSAQASKLLQCVASGPGYANASPTLGPSKASSLTVDGIKAARVDADVTIADPARNVKGDSLSIVAIDTKPVTIFLGATPIGDAASAGLINQIIGSLKVAK